MRRVSQSSTLHSTCFMLTVMNMLRSRWRSPRIEDSWQSTRSISEDSGDKMLSKSTRSTSPNLSLKKVRTEKTSLSQKTWMARSRTSILTTRGRCSDASLTLSKTRLAPKMMRQQAPFRESSQASAPPESTTSSVTLPLNSLKVEPT